MLIAAVALCFFTVLFVLLQACVERLLAPRLASALRRQLVKTLSQRFDSPVSVGALQVRYDKGLLVQGGEIHVASVLQGVSWDGSKPMLQVKRFGFRTSLFSLLRPTPQLEDVTAQGILLELPPVAARGKASSAGKSIAFESASFEDAHVVFASGDPERAPLTFDFPRGELNGIRPGKPFHFSVEVDNGPPTGTMQTTGTAGPWNFDDPRRTHVQGSFAFQDRDMGRVPGLRGHLTVNGTYRGTFAQMRAEGTTDDPAFGLDVSSRTVPLHTRFAVLVDAVASVVHLEDLEADLLQTRFTCQGKVTKSRSYPGYDFDFHLAVPKGRVEDALLLGTRTVPPVLRGDLTLRGTLHMHAGAGTVSSRLRLSDATFHLDRAVFNDAKVQQQIEDMSERALGNPEDANAREASPSPMQADGNLTLADSVLHFQQVDAKVSGAQATLAGEYELGTTAYRFNGAVHTAAQASQMTTGLKRLLVRPFNRLFSHGRDGATMPLQIRGAGSAITFDLVLPGGKKIAAPAAHQ